jgi:hypothetical protein
VSAITLGKVANISTGKVIIGDSATAGGSSGISIGSSASTSAQNGLAIGNSSKAAGSAVGIGYQAEATGNSIAIGYGVKVTGSDAIGIGRSNSTAYTIAIGNDSVSSVILGPLTIEIGSTSLVFRVNGKQTQINLN